MSMPFSCQVLAPSPAPRLPGGKEPSLKSKEPGREAWTLAGPRQNLGRNSPSQPVCGCVLGGSILTISPSCITDLSWRRECVTQWNYEPCCAGPPKTDRSQWGVLTNCGPLGEGMVNHSSIFAKRPHESCDKAKRYDIGRCIPQIGGVQYDTGEE